jgi:AmmeMemoRadiSam system protein B
MPQRCWIALIWTLLAVPYSWSRTYHYSSWSDNPQPYLQAIQRSSPHPHEAPCNRNLRAGIVTHHFLASGLMVRLFEQLRDNISPDTIILIGPNHFHHGRGNISLSSLPWKTPFGGVDADRPMIEKIRTATARPDDTEAFTGEHSVGILIPLVRYYFPHSRVAPILIDVNADESQLRALRGVLANLLRNPKVFVLLSMDFSHNSTAGDADSRDEEAEQAVSALDVGRVSQLHVDCHKGLWLLLAALRDLGRVQVGIEEHTNSSRLTMNPSQRNVTSYFTVCFAQ